ncbi:MAG: 4Fe-4S binding protein [Clostridia bacterium]|nr:4Fe-4S binding protein [Clostridia bacterium]
MEKDKYFHSVSLDRDECKGCTNCVKKCPTEAIRIRNGKAKIIKERCIDCGECIRTCPYHAKKAVTDNYKKIFDYTYKIALPAPTLYGQFSTAKDINIILKALKLLGFDEIYEVLTGADMVSEATKEYLKRAGIKKPVINSACPAVVRLIQIRFPNLVDHILPLMSPVECVAREARKSAVEKTGLPEDKIGVFFISPCAAKMTSYINPLGLEKSELDGVISISDIYGECASFISKLEADEDLTKATASGLSWAISGGETKSLNIEKSISVSGIRNVINVLEELDDERIDDIDFVECLACTGGCVGGALTVENPFVASARISQIAKNYDISYIEKGSIIPEDLMLEKEIEYIPVMNLGKTMKESMEIMAKTQQIYETMPRLDCGSCGAPSCNALSEDIARGFAKELDCVFKFKEKLNFLINEMNQLDD